MTNYRGKLGIHVNVHMSKIVCTLIKVGTLIYAMHTNCRTLNVVSCWYSNLMSHTHKYTHTHTHTQTHTTHSGTIRLMHPYEYNLHHLLCAHSSYLYYNEWIYHWHQKFTFHNVFSFQKWFTCKSKTRFFLWNTNNTDRNGVNKQNTSTPNIQRKITLERVS